MPARTPDFHNPPDFIALQPFPAGVSGIQLVPEFDVLLVLLPAQEHLFITDDCREIDQPASNVLDLDFTALEFRQYLFQAGKGSDPFIDEITAQVAARSHQTIQTPLEFLQIGVQLSDSLQPLPDLGQQGAGFLSGVVFLKLERHDAQPWMLNDSAI